MFHVKHSLSTVNYICKKYIKLAIKKNYLIEIIFSNILIRNVLCIKY